MRRHLHTHINNHNHKIINQLSSRHKSLKFFRTDTRTRVEFNFGRKKMLRLFVKVNTYGLNLNEISLHFLCVSLNGSPIEKPYNFLFITTFR